MHNPKQIRRFFTNERTTRSYCIWACVYRLRNVRQIIYDANLTRCEKKIPLFLHYSRVMHTWSGNSLQIVYKVSRLSFPCLFVIFFYFLSRTKLKTTNSHTRKCINCVCDLQTWQHWRKVTWFCTRPYIFFYTSIYIYVMYFIFYTRIFMRITGYLSISSHHARENSAVRENVVPLLDNLHNTLSLLYPLIYIHALYRRPITMNEREREKERQKQRWICAAEE